MNPKIGTVPHRFTREKFLRSCTAKEEITMPLKDGFLFVQS